MFAWPCIDCRLAIIELAVLKGQGLMRCCVIRCMEEMGDWGKVLEVIDLETSESAAAGESAIEEVVTELDDSRLFVTTDTWNGPKYLRCMFTQSMQAVMKNLLDCTLHGLFSNDHLFCSGHRHVQEHVAGRTQLYCACGRMQRPHAVWVDVCRSFVRSCLFQSSERGRLHEFVRSAAADADRMRLLQQYSGVELALEAAHSLEWDRFLSSKYCTQGLVESFAFCNMLVCKCTFWQDLHVKKNTMLLLVFECVTSAVPSCMLSAFALAACSVSAWIFL